jgi:hypothetical protein
MNYSCKSSRRNSNPGHTEIEASVLTALPVCSVRNLTDFQSCRLTGSPVNLNLYFKQRYESSRLQFSKPNSALNILSYFLMVLQRRICMTSENLFNMQPVTFLAK